MLGFHEHAESAGRSPQSFLLRETTKQRGVVWEMLSCACLSLGLRLSEKAKRGMGRRLCRREKQQRGRAARKRGTAPVGLFELPAVHAVHFVDLRRICHISVDMGR